MNTAERNQLITENIGLANKAAYTYRNILPMTEFADLVAIARLVMVESTGKFDAERGGYPNYIMRCVMAKFQNINRHETAQRRYRRRDLSLDYEYKGDGASLAEVIPGEVDDWYEDIDRRDMLTEMFKRLDGRTKRMVIMRCVHGDTYKQIARAYGVSQERVRQIVEDGLNRMRRAGYHDSEYVRSA